MQLNRRILKAARGDNRAKLSEYVYQLATRLANRLSGQRRVTARRLLIKAVWRQLVDMDLLMPYFFWIGRRTDHQLKHNAAIRQRLEERQREAEQRRQASLAALLS